jgi:hypothetical protein
VPPSNPSYEQFVAETFDSEEAVMIVSVLRSASRALSPGEVLDGLESEYGVRQEEPLRLAEKRVELRMRDLTRSGVVEQIPGGDFRYRGHEAGLDDSVERTIRQLTNDRAALNRLIYSTSSRARRLAEAFRI